MFAVTDYRIHAHKFNRSIRVLYSEYLGYFHIELHFIILGMWHQILLTKQAYLVCSLFQLAECVKQKSP